MVRVLESEGLLWVEPLKFSKQALSKAMELGQPKERISVEMVFRGLDHFSQPL